MAALLSAGPLAQGPPAAVRSVLESRRQIKFSGVRETQILTAEGRMIVTERVLRMGDRWRIEVVEGARRGSLAVESGRRRLQYSPEENVVRETPPFENESLARLLRLLSSVASGRVKVTETDGSPVAGHETRLVLAEARRGAVLAKAWINVEHGAVLKLETFGPNGQRTTYFEFTSIDFSPNLGPRTFEIDRPGAKVVTLDEELAVAARGMRLPPYRLPRSSRWRLAHVRRVGGGEAAALMQVYHDDSVRLSLFLMRRPVNEERLKRLAGAVNAHAFERDGVHLVLIGNVPENALRRLAATVELSGTRGPSRPS
jgi:outer membrane lipoprotein-sorting protein